METTDAHPPGAFGENIPPCEIHVDEEGDWYHRGNPMVREDIVALFLENLQLRSDGAYWIEWNQSVCALDAADTVFVVSRVDRIREEHPAREHQEQILLTFKHFREREPLDPGTLRVGANHVLYCLVRDKRFPARFSRPAYYQLAEWIQEDLDGDGFFLDLNGRRFVIGTEEDR